MFRIQNKNSSPLPIQNGVPQGDVFSVPLFLIAINDITKNVYFPITQRLFDDDYNISIRSSHPNGAHRLLQKTLNKISTWASKNGFRFSSLKTYLVIFKRRNPIPSLEPLFLQNFQISLRDSAKLLSILFDQKLTCTPPPYQKS